MSDDNVSVFIQQIAFSLVTKVPEAIESLFQVQVQVFIEAHMSNVEFTTDLFVTIPRGFHVQSHHPATDNGVFMFYPFFLELKDLGFRKWDAPHTGPPVLGSWYPKDAT